MSDSDTDGQLVRVEQERLALSKIADNRILSEMVGASLALARDSIVAPIDLDALVREGEKLYRDLDGMTEENIRAFQLFLRAAEANHTKAQSWLGICYDEGNGVTRDYVKAAKWYRKAAEQGDSYAQDRLGSYYAIGDGVPQDHVEAVKWYRKAAEQGASFAQNHLGECYDNGDGVPQDHVEAVKWYRKAVEQRYPSAQKNLGYCYRYGRGVAMDRLQAYKWFRLAADMFLVEGAKEQATELAALMSPSELEAAHALYREAKEKGL